MTSINLQIDGMHCDNCAKRLTTVLSRAPGVRRATVSLGHQRAVIEYEPQATSPDTIANLIEDAGFSARPR